MPKRSAEVTEIPAARSRNMAAIKGRNTTPEMVVRRYLHANGFRFRLHRLDLPGRPDIVLPKYKVAVLVHGCFWHRHSCRFAVWPKTRADFWRAKLTANVQRDRRNVRALRRAGWEVVVLWECDLSTEQLDRVLLAKLNAIGRRASEK